MAQSETNSAEELMTAYLDHEMDAEESEAFEAMFADSPETQEELSDLRQVLQLVQGLPEVEAPPDFFEKVAKKIRRRKLLDGEIPLFITVSFQHTTMSRYLGGDTTAAVNRPYLISQAVHRKHTVI